MKRLITLVMAAILVVMATVNFNVQQASAIDMGEICKEEISHYPFLKDDPYFMEDCGPYINTTNTTSFNIVDHGLVDFCTYVVEDDPQAKEDRFFNMECSDALKTANTCREIFGGSQSVFDQLVESGVEPGEFLDYCDKLEGDNILARKF
ncbi:MAG: hypothetical protein F6K10_20130 [Moorea sp. SIO2B7]|nr:hypothetical protein [Moorena sp. SIO2B7]